MYELYVSIILAEYPPFSGGGLEFAYYLLKKVVCILQEESFDICVVCV